MIIPRLPHEHAVQHPDDLRRYSVVGGRVFLHANDDLSGVPAELLRAYGCFLGPLKLHEAEAARSWLHEGALKAYFRVEDDLDAQGLEEALGGLPRERVGLCVHVTDLSEQAIAQLAARVVALRGLASSLVAARDQSCAAAGVEGLLGLCKAVRAALKAAGPERMDVLIDWRGLSEADVAALHKAEVDVVAEADVGAPGPLPALRNAPFDAVDAFIACLRTDREDGLYTTVVVDESNHALGLVYSSAESIKESVRSGRGVYYSRSRGGLWRKGDTSGAVQELVGIDVDCDSDALRFIVRQKGEPPAFCHLNRRNCWAEDKGLGALQRTLQSRKLSAPEGSYTSRLFKDPELLRNKLLEEAQELIEAEDKDHVAAEAADLLYFALVRCVAAEVSLEDVERHLDARTLKLARRPGNAKAHRIEAAEAVLKGGKANGTA